MSQTGQKRKYDSLTYLKDYGSPPTGPSISRGDLQPGSDTIVVRTKKLPKAYQVGTRRITEQDAEVGGRFQICGSLIAECNLSVTDSVVADDYVLVGEHLQVHGGVMTGYAYQAYNNSNLRNNDPYVLTQATYLVTIYKSVVLRSTEPSILSTLPLYKKFAMKARLTHTR